MSGIGMPELIVILIIGFIVLGPKKLPGIGRAIAKGIREFRHSLEGMDEESNSEQEDTPQTESKGEDKDLP